MSMTLIFGHSICLRMLKWKSLVTMYSASEATARQGLQKAVGVKNDAPHDRKGYACALRPIARWFAH